MSVKSRKFVKGILTKPTTDPATREGEQRTDSAENKQKIYLDGAERSIVTEDQAQTLTNKTIDADNNTVSNLETDNLKAGVLITDISTASSDTELPSALAVKTALAGQNEASEITYDPALNPETVNTDVQGALDDTGIASQAAQDAADAAQTTADNHIADATDAHTASAITNVPSGNLVATNVQGALNELQTEVDGKASSSEITDHINDPTDAHAASAITNTPSGNLAATDLQGAVNELQTDIDTRALDADLTSHTGASSGVHGVTGSVVGTTDTQTLTNKTITGASIQTPSRLDVKQDTQANLETYAASASNGQLCFATDTKLMYQVVDNALVSVGTGGGLKNYIENDKAEIDTSGWTVYANTTAGDLPDDFGGTPTGNLTFTRNTTSPLSGDADFKLSTTAANLQGEGVYYEFTLDKIDLSKVLSFIVRKDASDSGIADGDYRYVLVSSSDNFVADFNIIRSVSEDLKGSISDNIANFQTDASDLSYRLCIHRTTTDATATDLYLDELEFGPRNIGDRTNSGDSQVRIYEGNGNGSTNTVIRRFSTIIDNYGSAITYVDSATDGASFTINEAGLYAISYTDANEGTTNNYRFGISLNSTQLNTSIGNAGFNDEDRLAVSAVDNADGGVRNIAWSGILQEGDVIRPHTTGANFSDVGEVQFIITKVRASDEANALSGSGNKIYMIAQGGGSDSITANSTDIPFTKVTDTTSSWDGDSYTIPETGIYTFLGKVGFTASADRQFELYIDGSQYTRVSDRVTNSDNSIQYLGYFTKGQVITFRSRFNGGTTVSGEGDRHYLTIQKVSSGSGSQDLVPTVAAIYSTDSGQSTNSTESIVVYEDLIKDTHNSYNTSTGVFTTPITGYYQVNSSIFPTDAGSFATITMRKNSTDYSRMQTYTTSNRGITHSELVYLEKNDTFEIFGRTSNSTSLRTNSYENILSIIRIK